jgi:hypothetical protein
MGGGKSYLFSWLALPVVLPKTETEYEEKSGLDRKQFINLRTTRTYIRFEDIISDKISFKTPKLQQFLIDLKRYNHRVGTEFGKEIFINNIHHYDGDNNRIYLCGHSSGKNNQIINNFLG